MHLVTNILENTKADKNRKKENEINKSDIFLDYYVILQSFPISYIKITTSNYKYALIIRIYYFYIP